MPKKTINVKELEPEIQEELSWQEKHEDALIKQSKERSKKRKLNKQYLEHFLEPLMKLKNLETKKETRELLEEKGIYQPSDERFKGSYPDVTVEELFKPETPAPKKRGRPPKQMTEEQRAEAERIKRVRAGLEAPKSRGRKTKPAEPESESESEEEKPPTPKRTVKKVVKEEPKKEEPKKTYTEQVGEDIKKKSEENEKKRLKDVGLSEELSKKSKERMYKLYDVNNEDLFNFVLVREGGQIKEYNGNLDKYRGPSDKVVSVITSFGIDNVVITIMYYNKDSMIFGGGPYKTVTILISPSDMLEHLPGLDYKPNQKAKEAIYDEKVSDQTTGKDLHEIVSGVTKPAEAPKPSKPVVDELTKKISKLKKITDVSDFTELSKKVDKKQLEDLSKELRSMKVSKLDQNVDRMAEFEQLATLLKNKEEIKAATKGSSKAKKTKYAYKINEMLKEKNMDNFLTKIDKLKVIPAKSPLYEGETAVLCKIEAVENKDALKVILKMEFSDGRQMGIMFAYDIKLMERHPELPSFMERIAKRVNDLVKSAFA